MDRLLRAVRGVSGLAVQTGLSGEVTAGAVGLIDDGGAVGAGVDGADGAAGMSAVAVGMSVVAVEVRAAVETGESAMKMTAPSGGTRTSAEYGRL